MSGSVTFFRGETWDGYAWVLSFEGGPTAMEPDARCRCSGMVRGPGGHIKLKRLDAFEGSELRAMLPGLDADEVPGALGELFRLRCRRLR